MNENSNWISRIENCFDFDDFSKNFMHKNIEINLNNPFYVFVNKIKKIIIQKATEQSKICKKKSENF